MNVTEQLLHASRRLYKITVDWIFLLKLKPLETLCLSSLYLPSLWYLFIVLSQAMAQCGTQ